MPLQNYLTKQQTGLPFDICKDSLFDNYFAVYANTSSEKLKPKDIINAHILMELRKNKRNEKRNSKLHDKN